MTDDERLRLESAEIEQLLEEARELSTVPVWERVEEALRRVVTLYGAGIAHVLVHARAAGADERLEHSCCDDELLGSLLVLHGLHPLSMEARIRRALDAVHARLGLAPETVVLAGIVDQVAELRAARPVDDAVIRRAIGNAAPELAEIRIATEPALRRVG